MTRSVPINCEEALRALAELLDGELDGELAERVNDHLERCRSCYSRADFERRLRERVAALRHEPVGAPFERRIRRMIDELSTADAGGRNR